MISWQSRVKEAKRSAHKIPVEQLSQEQRHLFTRPYCSRPESEQINNHDSTGRRAYTMSDPVRLYDVTSLNLCSQSNAKFIENYTG